MTHTPGPWKFIAGDDYYIDAIDYPAEYPHLFKGDDTGDHLATVRVATAGNRTADFGEANARLIAAAPDLLAALEELLGSMGASDNSPHKYLARQKAARALNEAKGE